MSGLFDRFNPQSRIANNQYGFSSKTITRGSLISFHYPVSYAKIPNVIHDPYPMIIVTDIWPKYIRGVNLHYITFPFIKSLLQQHGGNTGFSYSHIKSNSYLAQSFRMYVRMGVRQPRKLDTDFLLDVLGTVRSLAPGEFERIKKVIQAQIQQRLQVKANELQSYEQWRASLSQGQKGSFDRKVRDIRTDLQGGYNRSLVKPDITTGTQGPKGNTTLPKTPPTAPPMPPV